MNRVVVKYSSFVFFLFLFFADFRRKNTVELNMCGFWAFVFVFAFFCRGKKVEGFSRDFII